SMADLARAWALLEAEAASLAARVPRLAPPGRTLGPGSAFESAEDPAAEADDPMARLLARASGGRMRVAAPDFTTDVLRRLPARPAPLPTTHLAPSARLAEYARVVGGTLGFWALLMFGSSWLIALASPAFAFAALAALVSL